MMHLTILGGCGAWPVKDQPCSGYLVQSEGFRLFVDPGYATFPALQEYVTAGQVDAVLVTHGHPDHCADLNPLLRARALTDEPPAPLPVYTLPSALDAVLCLDRPGMLRDSFELREFQGGDSFGIGPFRVDTRLLPHFVPNAGVRLSAGGMSLAYTGDTGPSPEVTALARDADVLLCEATYVDQVPRADEEFLLSARLAGEYAEAARAARLLLTHLWPGTGQAPAVNAAARAFTGPVEVAHPGLMAHVPAAASPPPPGFHT
ncbi:MBL fold metallo-hydrolase [Streptomyces djakartensis]|uniref:MBL fold metallo-hydrolase n=1 Tax=Streptomyces djakartensis TaxID=68193 RepID=A0ABQ2ZC34_9ACTN|nr:MBL fold metallo-hydrolase [Streptomyces djakartensis]GGY07955.1 MBL fold metallo-hydrolase [Streptomyces djakartensis]